MNILNPSISVHVDPSNPGQFFACCGLLELADRLWPGAEGYFAPRAFSGSSGDVSASAGAGWGAGDFHLICAGDVATLMRAIAQAPLALLDPEKESDSPVELAGPFSPSLRVDWWRDETGKGLKTWAGSMRGPRIAQAMQQALQDPRFHGPDMFQVGDVVYDENGKKAEPFYFDARRALNAHSQDVGFSLDGIEATTLAYPAVEFLCLVGLERARPVAEEGQWFRYSLWTRPIGVVLLAPAVAGLLPGISGPTYRFENAYRTSQRKHKAFRLAQRIS